MTARPATSPRAPDPPLGLVLRRELIRVARRPRTWVLRVGYTAALFAFLVFVLSDQLEEAGLEPSLLSQVGRQMFGIYTALQITAVCLLTPLLVASGIQEEQEARTLDLLTLTGVPASRLLLDQVGSRLWVLLATVLAGMPVVSLLNSLGGVSPVEVINGFYGAVGTALVLASFSAFAALVTRSGPVLPALLCLPYALVGFVGTWVVLALPESGSRDAFASPFHAAASADALAPLGGLLWVPALITGWQLTVPVFRILTGGDEQDEGFGWLSLDFWNVERYRTRTVLWVFAAGVAVVVTFLLADFPVAPLLALPAAALFALAWQRVALLSVMWLGERLTTRQHLTWRLRPRTTRPVFGPVVAWRELFTRAGGAARLVPLAVLVPWLGIAALAALQDPSRSEDTAAALATLAALGGWTAGTAVAVATILDDRRRDTLPLLFLSRVKPWHAAVQKLVAPVALAAPVILLANAWWGLSLPDPYSDPHTVDAFHALGPNLALPVPPELVWNTWDLLVAANCAAFAAAAASLPRQPAAAWPVGLLAGFLWFTWPVFLAIGLGEGSLQGLLHAAYPRLLDEHARGCLTGGVPGSLLAGLALQATALPFAVAALTRRLRALGGVSA